HPQDLLDTAMVEYVNLEPRPHQLSRNVSLEVGKAEHEIGLQGCDPIDFGARESGNARLLPACPRWAHRETRYPNDPPVLLEEIQRLGGLLRQAHNALGEPCCRHVTLEMMWLRFWAFLDWCFFGPASTRPGLVALLVRILRYPYAVIRDLARGAINLRAMGLVYTTLLSLIPLLAFTFAILKVFGAHRDLQPVVYEFFRPVGGNAATELTTRVLQFADRVSSGLVGTVGFALLAWTLLGTIKKVEDSFNFLWRVDHPRSFARRVAEYLALLVIGPILLVGFVGL